MATKIELEHQRLLNYQNNLVIGFFAVLAIIVVPEGGITLKRLVLIFTSTVVFLISITIIHLKLRQIEDVHDEE